VAFEMKTSEFGTLHIIHDVSKAVPVL